MEAVFECRGEEAAYVHEQVEEDAVINRAAGVTDEMLLTALDRAIARASGEPIPLQSHFLRTTVWRGTRYADGVVVWRNALAQWQASSSDGE